jgi:glycosyltransferase involved in cell wall biosynthesis
MMRVLYIARGLDSIMERKFALLAAEPDLDLWLARPGQRESHERAAFEPSRGYPTRAIPILYSLDDPHRALYRTLTFGAHAASPDLIHAEAEPDSLAALQVFLARRLFASQARVILHTWQNVNRPRQRHVEWVLQASLRCAEAILCANHEAMALLARMGYKGQMVVIPPHGVNSRVFRPVASRPASDAFTIAYVGRFVPEKGLDVLIESIRLLALPVRLLMIGDGPIRQELEAQASRAGVHEQVSFIGRVAPEQLPGRLAQADVLVLPSRTTPVWKEQFGRVLIEAMACKVPVVGSDSGAIPEVVGDAGLIFPEGNAAALADCLRRLIESPALRHGLAERGHQRVMQHYTQERIAEKTAAFYRGIIAI